MPGMPFHLEKGHALMAIEDLLNNPAHHAVLRAAFEGLRTNLPVANVFNNVAAAAPGLAAYGGQPDVVAAGGLGPFVAGAWFAAPGAPGPTPYWLDYRGNVDNVVRETLLLAMEVAWGVDRNQPLPGGPFQRRIELFWHCGQRWFEAWTTWDDPQGPVKILFASPPHTGGEVVANVAPLVAAGQANVVDRTTVNLNRDMVLISQPRHVEVAPNSPTSPSQLGQVPLPSVGTAFQGTGPVGRWSIHADSGGMNPISLFT